MEPIVRLATSVQKSIGNLLVKNKNNRSPIGCNPLQYTAEGAAFDALNALGEEGLAKLVNRIRSSHRKQALAPARGCKDEETGVATSSCSI